MRKFIYLLIIFISFSCSHYEFSDNLETNKFDVQSMANSSYLETRSSFENDSILEEYALNALNSFEFQQLTHLIEYQLGLISDYINKGNDFDQLKQAMIKLMSSGDNADFINLIFGNQESGLEYIIHFNQLTDSLFSKFPELNNDECINHSFSSLDYDSLLNNIDIMLQETKFFGLVKTPTTDLRPNGGPNNDSTVDPDIPICGSYWQQIKLGACAVLCGAATSGLGSVICLWACWCQFCTENSEVGAHMC